MREYFIGDIYSLVMDKGLTPKLHLICDGKGDMFMGSEFIDNFTTLADFDSNNPLWDLRTCFPYKCGDTQFIGAEKIFALAMILGDMDLHTFNMGVVPTNQPGVYNIAKIDHDGVANCFLNPVSLRSLAKVVIGEGKEELLTGFNLKNLDEYKIAEAFEEIGKIPDWAISQTIQNRIQELKDSTCGKPSAIVESGIENLVQMMQQVEFLITIRKELCLEYAKGATIEGAVRKIDLDKVKAFVEAGNDINGSYSYIFIDTQPSKIGGKGLVQIFSLISKGRSDLTKGLIAEAANNKPVNILELCVHYKKAAFATKLLENFEFQTSVLEKALKAAKTKKHKPLISVFTKAIEKQTQPKRAIQGSKDEL